MRYNNKITPKQFIGAIAFVLGVSFGYVVASEGCLHHWVSYWGGIFLASK